MAGVVGVYRTKHRRGESCSERERGRRQKERRDEGREQSLEKRRRSLLSLQLNADCSHVSEARWRLRKHAWVLGKGQS